MSIQIDRNWLTLKEAAAAARISRDTLRRYLRLRKNKPPAYKLVPNGRWRFPEEEFLAWKNGKKDK